MQPKDAMNSLAERKKLPGYDEARHNSVVLDEFVEERNGKKFVVYRTKMEIVKAAADRFTAPVFKRN